MGHNAKGSTFNVARVLARAGTNMTLACPGLSPTSYVYLVEWKCIGCKCTGCPDPNGEGTRILRFNNELTRWDTASREEVARRTLDIRNYGLKFEPVSAEDTGTYLCLINNRREPDAPLQLTVEGKNGVLLGGFDNFGQKITIFCYFFCKWKFLIQFYWQF